MKHIVLSMFTTIPENHHDEMSCSFVQVVRRKSKGGTKVLGTDSLKKLASSK